MSSNDPKDPKNLPPDDFSKTTPYVRLPKDEPPSSSPPASDYTSDWEKTNFNYSIPQQYQQPPQTPSGNSSGDDWSKTSFNIPPASSPPPSNKPSDFDKTFMPGQSSSSSPQSAHSDWNMTQANINLGSGGNSDYEDFGGNSAAKRNDFSATTPYINLPESERAKYEQQQTQQQSQPNQPPSHDKKDEKKRAATPAWIWFGSVAVLFFLIAAIMIGAYFIFSKRYGYDVEVKGAQPGSDVFVDGTRWGYTSPNGSLKLTGLSAGAHKIEIKHPQFVYETEQITGDDGGKTVEIVAKSRQIAGQNDPSKGDCENIKKGDFDKAAKCANDAMDKLGDKFSVEELLRAMNLYIINFAVNKYDIKPNDLNFLEKSAGFMKKLPPNVKIEVGGHTDSTGDPAKNMKLSENRANSVREALIKFGVKSEMLEMRGYGATRPRPGNTNANEDEKFQNRRIEYTAIIR